jgi:hypothetical protein
MDIFFQTKMSLNIQVEFLFQLTFANSCLYQNFTIFGGFKIPGELIQLIYKGYIPYYIYVLDITKK